MSDRVDEIERRGGAHVTVAGTVHEVRLLMLPVPGEWADAEEPVLRLADVRLLIAEAVAEALDGCGRDVAAAYRTGLADARRIAAESDERSEG